MTYSAPSPFSRSVRWLATFANFPSARLGNRAELLLLIAAAAEQEEVASQRSPRFLIERRDVAADASLRAYTKSRSLAHYVCDNKQKV